MSRKYASIVVYALILGGCGSSDRVQAHEKAKADTLDEEVEVRTPNYNADRNAYFGDMHIHTRNSFDAYIFNVRRTADDAYRFAKGETIKHPSGFDMTIADGPLDFYTVTDHAEYLGILPAMNTEGSALNKLPIAKQMFSDDPEKILAAFAPLSTSVASGEKNTELYDGAVIQSAWQENIAAAEKYNEPGVFTTFSAYEFTSITAADNHGGVGGGNLHRNVFFRGEAPDRAFSTLDSTNPEDLWDWMDQQRSEGRESIAIPHNSNISDGQMFRLETYNGDQMDAAYVEQRMRNEPLVEVTQVKGTSETHPDLSPNDEWANFEIFDALIDSNSTSKSSGSYVREAYRNGLKLQEEKGYDPFRFGLVGASDTHVAGASYSEKDYWSKIGILDGLPFQRGSVPMPGITDWAEQPDNLTTQNAQRWFSRWSASGLTGVWAEENTRDAIFDAFQRKETFATTGPRMKVRFFGGFDYDGGLLDSANLAHEAYERGVPMGGDLVGTGNAPSFIAWAQRDPHGGTLQRLQVVKVTSEAEEVIDVACDNGTPDPSTQRCTDNGASVDLSTCIPANRGASELKVLWKDPNFDASRRATYYVRVLENPTCRWSTWEAMRNGTPPRPGSATTLQERAYTSPIWYIPSN
jgi:hypothetical protein